MKKTLTINIGGSVFHIDEDAYRLLDNYLCKLKRHLGKESGADQTLNDTELRISALFAEKVANGSQVVTIADVEEATARTGKVEDPEPSADDTVRYRLYRNPDDRILGGVISGLCDHQGWDTTLCRLLYAFCALFCFTVLIPAYIICWIVIPASCASTSRPDTHSERRSSGGAHPKSTSGCFPKGCLVLLAVIFSPILLVFGIVLMALLLAAIVVALCGSAALIPLLPPDITLAASPLSVIMLCITMLFVAGIPLAAILFAVFRRVFGWCPMPSRLKWGLTILWIVSATVFFIFS